MFDPSDGTLEADSPRTLTVIAAIRDARLPMKEKLVLVMLASRARPIQGEGWVCWPSLATMALDTGLGERSISRALATIERLGLVDIDRGTGRTVSRYVLDYYAIADLPSDPRRPRRDEW